MSDRLSDAVAELDEATALDTARAALAAGSEALAVIEACRQGMARVGERFARGEYFVSDLIMAAAIFARVTRLAEPLLSTGPRPARGAVVMGTVKGDLHDIGKNLAVLLLRAAGYEVRDLGVNVPPQRFVDALRESGATVLGLSALLTTSFGAMKATVDAVEAAGLRPRVRIMLGGGPVDGRVQALAGADAWGATAQEAVNLCDRWVTHAGGR
jgi:methanogenic corrinoid protein MtbC1